MMNDMTDRWQRWLYDGGYWRSLWQRQYECTSTHCEGRVNVPSDELHRTVWQCLQSDLHQWKFCLRGSLLLHSSSTVVHKITHFPGSEADNGSGWRGLWCTSFPQTASFQLWDHGCFVVVLCWWCIRLLNASVTRASRRVADLLLLKFLVAFLECWACIYECIYGSGFPSRIWPVFGCLYAAVDFDGRCRQQRVAWP